MKAKVIPVSALIYEKDSGLSAVIGSVKRGTILDIEAEYGEWVKLADGGWVKACYTEAVEVSGGVSSWNDLTDKPFYETVELTQIYPYDSESESFAGFEEGETYVVVYDGASREYEAWANGSNVCIGRGDPFEFGASRGALVCSGDIDWDKLSSISHKKTVVTALDVKYLPESHQFGATGGVIEWDGNTEGLTCVDGVFYKVSDLTPTLDEVANGTVGIVFEGTYEEFSVASAIEGDLAYDEGSVFAFGDNVIVALEDGAFLSAFSDGLTFPEAGVYFCKFEEESTCTKLLSWGEVKRLDGNYLPWLKITYDGESYAANMTYEEAAALLDSKSLLGGCFINELNAVISFGFIDTNSSDGLVYALDQNDVRYCVYSDGFVTKETGGK